MVTLYTNNKQKQQLSSIIFSKPSTVISLEDKSDISYVKLVEGE